MPLNHPSYIFYKFFDYYRVCDIIFDTFSNVYNFLNFLDYERIIHVQIFRIIEAIYPVIMGIKYSMIQVIWIDDALCIKIFWTFWKDDVVFVD